MHPLHRSPPNGDAFAPQGRNTANIGNLPSAEQSVNPPRCHSRSTKVISSNLGRPPSPFQLRRNKTKETGTGAGFWLWNLGKAHPTKEARLLEFGTGPAAGVKPVDELRNLEGCVRLGVACPGSSSAQPDNRAAALPPRRRRSNAGDHHVTSCFGSLCLTGTSGLPSCGAAAQLMRQS